MFLVWKLNLCIGNLGKQSLLWKPSHNRSVWFCPRGRLFPSERVSFGPFQHLKYQFWMCHLRYKPNSSWMTLTVKILVVHVTLFFLMFLQTFDVNNLNVTNTVGTTFVICTRSFALKWAPESYIIISQRSYTNGQQIHEKYSTLLNTNQTLNEIMSHPIS